MDECKRCKKEIRNKKYNQIYCSQECRLEEYTFQYWNKKTKDRCVICNFPYFTERHHIIKKMDWVSDIDMNCVYLCKNHHLMADSIYFEELMKDLIFKKTSKKGLKLSQEEIDFLKKEIIEIIVHESPETSEENLKENSWAFNYTKTRLIQNGDFYKILEDYTRLKI